MFLKKSKIRGEFIMKSERMVMRFEGENDISLDTLTNALSSTVDTLKILAGDLMSENDFCRFKVVNIQEGSFIITIDQIIKNSMSLLPLMPTVLETLKELLEIRKFLKRMPPKSITYMDNKVKIENNHGNIYNANSITLTVYNN